MSAAPTTLRALRSDLESLAESAPPMPRAFFVDELEDRLASMMQGTPGGDVFPDIVVTRIEKAPRQHRGVAASIALVVVALTAGFGAIKQASLTVDVDSGRDGLATPAAAFGGSDDVDAGEGPLDGPVGALRRPRSESRTQPQTGQGETTAPNVSVDAKPITVWPEIDEEALAAATGRERPAEIGLRGSGTPAAVWLDWDRYEGDDFAAYLVLRAASPADPAYPDPSRRTLMMLRIENRDQLAHRDSPKVGTTPRYRIVVVDSDDRVVASSPVYEANMGATTGRISQLPQPPTS